MRKGNKSKFYTNVIKNKIRSEWSEFNTFPDDNTDCIVVVDMMAFIRKYQKGPCSSPIFVRTEERTIVL